MLPKLLRTAILWLATALVGCALPPERNPAPAYQSAVELDVLLPRTGTPLDGDLVDVATLAAARLNRSRSPTERPVRVTPGQGEETQVRVAALTVYAAAAKPRGELLVDPRFPPTAVESAASIDAAVALYDAVLVAGLAARQVEATPMQWLRAQPGWRLGLGMTHFRNGDTAPTGTRIAAR